MKRKFRRDERGAAPFLTIASVVIFAVLSTGITYAISAAFQTLGVSQVNAALTSAISEQATRTAATGYDALGALPASSTISVSVAGKTVSATQTIAAVTGSSAKKVTISAGRFTGTTFYATSTCSTTPSNCVSASDVAALPITDIAPTITQATAGTAVTGTSSPVFTGMSVSYQAPIALQRNGQMWTWGTKAPTYTPVQVGSAQTFTQVAAGFTHWAALDSSGALWTWGTSTLGALGQGATTTNATPKKIAAGPFKAVYAGSDVTYALDLAGNVWAAGNNSTNQLGEGVTAASTSTLQLTEPRPFTTLAVGTSHVVALASDGTVWTWGQLPGTTTKQVTPVQALTGTFTQIAAGLNTTMVMNASGQVYGWGNNPSRMLGINQDPVATPTLVPIAFKAAQIELGSTAGAIIDTAGNVYFAGYNLNGELGVGAIGGTVPAFTKLTSLSATYTQVSLGSQSTLLMTVGGGLYGLGVNESSTWTTGTQDTPHQLFANSIPTTITPWTGTANLPAGTSNIQIGIQSSGSVVGVGVMCATTNTIISQGTAPSSLTSGGYRYVNITVPTNSCASPRAAVFTDDANPSNVTVSFYVIPTAVQP
ncbi:RCC1 domain-containing protein [Microbacterium ginsengisoli]|nr:hypothetical protein [Microbacteriaceae bacterium K1510]